MKKILTLFAVVGLIAFTSCSDDDNDNVDYDTIGAVYENMAPNYYNFVSPNYSVRFNFPQPIVESDVVLVYRYDGVDDANQPVWQALPETYFLSDGSRDFSFKYVFTRNYVNIYLDGNNRSTISADYRLEQILRIVVVPADFVSSVNKESYLDVTSKLNIKENQVQKINF